ncbi:MAG: transglycosylase domain-containing protein [Tannerella sp.]|jgi:penicillin-binding protein 1A|nr:transglycosylase domain-containing protein [Tannerella sp.]
MNEFIKKIKTALKKINNKIIPSRKKINKTLWIGFGLFIVAVTAVFVAISNGLIGYVPPIEQLENNPIDRYASQLISEDEVLLGSYSLGKDNRMFVTYEDLSPDLVHALIATEDVRFSKHSGIDIKGVLRAIIKRGLLMQKSGGGGSTITQQLAKQLYSPSAGNIVQRLFQKPIEWVIAVRLEKYYTKEEIINMYLSKFDFLYNAVGIHTAARSYFNTTPRDLKLEEAATLVGMCKNPSLYNPVKFLERSQGRRNIVLQQMEKYGYLNKATCDSLCNLPLELNFTRIDHKEGLAPYFREYIRLMMIAEKPDKSDYPAWAQEKFTEDSIMWENNPLYGWCNKNTKSNGKNFNLYTDGLKIYTTVNSRMQQYAENAVAEHIGKELQPQFFKEIKGKKYAPFSFEYGVPDKKKEQIINESLQRSVNQSNRYLQLKKSGASEEEIERVFREKTEMQVFSWDGPIDTVMSPIDSILYYKSFLRTGFMAMDSRNGHVKAYVGGIDFANFQYDGVTQGRRQIGSTMKPFLYSLAMTEGFTPCDELLHVQPQLTDETGKLWSPSNSTKARIGEMVTIQWGLQQSSNWITASLMDKLSPYALERLLRSFGFTGRIDAVPAMCLGTPDISVAEMVSAYSVFTNKGIRIEPMYVTRIEDSYGNVVATFPPRINEVLDEEATFKMLSMLRSVVDGGTAGRLRWTYKLTAPMGGKTGTTQNHSDGWFMGFTPHIVAGCWVGGEDRSIHFTSMSEGQGAAAALPVFAIFMQKVFADKELGYSEKDNFDVPAEYRNPCASGSRRVGEFETDTIGLDEFFN